MIPKIIRGRAYVVGSDIDTDRIIPARYLNTNDPAKLAVHAMEDLDPVQYPIRFLEQDGTCRYKFVVAGRNFGCGSSREHAPVALNAAGVETVVAQTFARIYYRNSVNVGRIILPLKSYVDLSQEIKTGDELEIDTDACTVNDITTGEQYRFGPLGYAKDIIEAGGLTEFNKRRLGIK